MVRSTNAPKKRTASTKKTQKKNTKKSNSLSLDTFKNSRVLIFALVFGIAGLFALFQINAKPNIAVADDEILAGYYKSRPTTMIQDEAGVITYESYTASYLLLGDGTLLCDDGNAEGTVTTAKLASGHVKNITSALSDLDLSTVPYEIAAPNTQEQVSNHEGFVFIGNERSHASTVYEGAQKPDKLAKMQDRIQKECVKATKKEQRGKTKEFKVPEVKSSSTDQSSVFSRVTSVLSPKASATAPAPAPSYTYPTPAYAYPTPAYAYPTPAYAYPTPAYAYPTPNTSTSAPTATLDNNASTHIADLTNSYRNSSGLPSLTRKACVDDIAKLHAKRMYERGQIFHNPNYTNEIIYACTAQGDSKVKNWTIMGENVGVGYDSGGLFNAYKASPGHNANLLNNKFCYHGSGAYRTPDGRLWHVHNFACWPR